MVTREPAFDVQFRASADSPSLRSPGSLLLISVDFSQPGDAFSTSLARRTGLRNSGSDTSAEA